MKTVDDVENDIIEKPVLTKISSSKRKVSNSFPSFLPQFTLRMYNSVRKSQRFCELGCKNIYMEGKNSQWRNFFAFFHRTGPLPSLTGGKKP